MSLPIDFHLEAVDEVDAAFAWYDDQRIGLGEEFLEALLGRLEQIQESPEAWAVLYRKIRACPMRRFPYIIYYRVLADRINIIAVQHGHRNPKEWRRRA